MEPPPMFLRGQWPADQFLCFRMGGHTWVTDSHAMWRTDMLLSHLFVGMKVADDETLVCVWSPNEPSEFDRVLGSLTPMGRWLVAAHPSEKVAEPLGREGAEMTPHPWVWITGRGLNGSSLWTCDRWTTLMDGRLTGWLLDSSWAKVLTFEQPEPLAPVRVLNDGEPVGLLMPQRQGDRMPPFPRLPGVVDGRLDTEGGT